MSGPAGDDVAEFHSTPSGHFVFSEATWERVKATFSNATVRDDQSIAGQTGVFSGSPVYVDRCPWDCHSTTIEPSPPEPQP